MNPPASNERPRWQIILGGMCALGLALGMARFAYTPMLPIMQREAGLGIALGGWLATINYLGYICGALLAAWLESPEWRRRAYLWGLGLGVLSTAGMALSADPVVWMVARFLGGLCGAAGMLLGAGLVLSWLMRHGHRAELGVYFIGAGLSIVITGLMAMGFVAAHWTWQAQWWGYTAAGLVLWAMAWWLCPEQGQAPAAKQATPLASGDMRRLIIMYFLAGIGFGVSATYTVAMVDAAAGRGASGPLTWIGVGLLAAMGTVVWDRIGRRWGQVQAIMWALLLQSLSVFWPAWMPTLLGTVGGAVLFGMTFTGIVATSLAVSGRLAPHNPGKAMARLTLAYGVAQVVAPAWTGMVVAATGHYEGALTLTGVMLLLGAAMLWPMRHGATAPPPNPQA